MQQDAYGIYDIYPLIRIPFWQTRFFWVCIGFFLSMLFFLLLYVCIVQYRIYRNKREIPLAQTVMHRLNKITIENYRDMLSAFYAEIGMIFRLFLTDIHTYDMLSFTEIEIEEHFFDDSYFLFPKSDNFFPCELCKQYGLLQNKATMCAFLERMSHAKYEENCSMQDAVDDLKMVTTLIKATYQNMSKKV